MRMARRVVLSRIQREILEGFSRARTRSQRAVERAKMVVMAGNGVSDAEIGRRLGVNVQRPRRWRGRWLAAGAGLADAEAAGASKRDLGNLIEDVLTDFYRSGGPPKFSAEQVAMLISLGCESPEESGIPITHWTPEELAREAVKRGVVESISPRHLDRIMKRGRPSAT